MTVTAPKSGVAGRAAIRNPPGIAGSHLTRLRIPLTFSIAEGSALGLTGAVLLALASSRFRSLPLADDLLTLVFFLEFFLIFPCRG